MEERLALLDRLMAEHRDLERRLAEIESHKSLTSAEQLERMQIKKLKLLKKDQILRHRVELQAQGTLPPVVER